MKNEKIRKALESLELEAVLFEEPSFDDAIIGVTSDGRVIYDYDLMCESLANEYGIRLNEAMDFIDYNTIRSLPYIDADKRPVVLFHLDEVE